MAVSVEPTPEDLTKQIELGFDFYQIHFNPQTPAAVIGGWAEAVGVSRLWLAPRLPPGVDIYPELLPFAETFLIDTFHPDKMGGTGTTGDWPKFKRYREMYPAKHWILSGGLDHGNVAEAVTATGAKFIDVNSGVEQAPGIKSPAKLKAFALALHNATKQDNPSYRIGPLMHPGRSDKFEPGIGKTRHCRKLPWLVSLALAVGVNLTGLLKSGQRGGRLAAPFREQDPMASDSRFAASLPRRTRRWPWPPGPIAWGLSFTRNPRATRR